MVPNITDGKRAGQFFDLLPVYSCGSLRNFSKGIVTIDIIKKTSGEVLKKSYKVSDYA